MKGYSYSLLPYCKWERGFLFWWFIFRSNSYTNRLKSRFFSKSWIKIRQGEQFFYLSEKETKVQVLLVAGSQHMCILWLLVLYVNIPQLLKILIKIFNQTQRQQHSESEVKKIRKKISWNPHPTFVKGTGRNFS